MSVSFSWSREGDNANVAPAPKVDTKQSVSVQDQLARIRDAWDPQSPNCAFQHYFYNKVPADQVGLYQMPPGQDQQKWERALMQRPDVESVPVLAVGFDALDKRVKLQNQQVMTYRARLYETNEKLAEIQNRHNLHTAVKLAEMKERHVKLAQRTLSLAVKLQVLANRGLTLTSEEELFQRKLREFLKQAQDPSAFGSLTEVWARIKVMREKMVPSTDVKECPVIDWDRDSDQLENIVSVLAAQQTGIRFLASLLEQDGKRVDDTLHNEKKLATHS